VDGVAPTILKYRNAVRIDAPGAQSLRIRSGRDSYEKSSAP
jgi:hypothetical protein